MTMSLDGFVVAPEGFPTGALPEPAELKRWKLDRISHAGAHLMGRVSYEEMGPYWQSSKDDYAAPMNNIPKVVFSRTLKKADWPVTTIANGDLAQEITALKNQPGGELVVWGGAGFAQAVTRAGLIDEYAIISKPIAYGGGKPLFRDLEQALKLKVLATTAYEGGTILRLYEPDQPTR
ncbi:dihydrofolate reductase family protein [Mesorhizobium sp. GbtcB19]|uniref:dihydrofolate reductase family protein n=1 Tax=Mesorhizobium sp. GbtcB19 TaxID=2824764 RepID=UPI001C2F53F7|nr:dihydrofolate reductase family protein [Mesorhizobium sp. GbtcB19]